MGRILEFAMATAIIYITNIAFTFFVTSIIGKKISELFNTVIEAFPII